MIVVIIINTCTVYLLVREQYLCYSVWSVYFHPPEPSITCTLHVTGLLRSAMHAHNGNERRCAQLTNQKTIKDVLKQRLPSETPCTSSQLERWQNWNCITSALPNYSNINTDLQYSVYTSFSALITLCIDCNHRCFSSFCWSTIFCMSGHRSSDGCFPPELKLCFPKLSSWQDAGSSMLVQHNSKNTHCTLMQE